MARARAVSGAGGSTATGGASASGGSNRQRRRRRGQRSGSGGAGSPGGSGGSGSGGAERRRLGQRRLRWRWWRRRAVPARSPATARVEAPAGTGGSGAGGTGGKPLPPGVQGHPDPPSSYPEYPGFTLALVEEFDQPLDLDRDPIWTWSDGGLPEGGVRFFKDAITLRRRQDADHRPPAERARQQLLRRAGGRRRRRLRPRQAPAQRRAAHQAEQLPLRPLRGAPEAARRQRQLHLDPVRVPHAQVRGLARDRHRADRRPPGRRGHQPDLRQQRRRLEPRHPGVRRPVPRRPRHPPAARRVHPPGPVSHLRLRVAARPDHLVRRRRAGAGEDGRAAAHPREVGQDHHEPVGVRHRRRLRRRSHPQPVPDGGGVRVVPLLQVEPGDPLPLRRRCPAACPPRTATRARTTRTTACRRERRAPRCAGRWRCWPPCVAYLSGCEAIDPADRRQPGRAAGGARSRCPTSSPPAATWATASARASCGMDVQSAACLPRPEAAAGDCYRFVYQPGRQAVGRRLLGVPGQQLGLARRPPGGRPALQAGAAAGGQRHPRPGGELHRRRHRRSHAAQPRPGQRHHQRAPGPRLEADPPGHLGPGLRPRGGGAGLVAGVPAGLERPRSGGAVPGRHRLGHRPRAGANPRSGSP